MNQKEEQILRRYYQYLKLEKRLLSMYRQLLSDVQPVLTADRIIPSLYSLPRRRFC